MNESELSKNTVKIQSRPMATREKLDLTFQPSLEMSKFLCSNKPISKFPLVSFKFDRKGAFVGVARAPAECKFRARQLRLHSPINRYSSAVRCPSRGN